MLSILMLAAIGVLISASMSTLMLLTAMEREPPLRQQPVQLASLQDENRETPTIERSVGTNRICDGKSAGSIRLLL